MIVCTYAWVRNLSLRLHSSSRSQPGSSAGDVHCHQPQVRGNSAAALFFATFHFESEKQTSRSLAMGWGPFGAVAKLFPLKHPDPFKDFKSQTLWIFLEHVLLIHSSESFLPSISLGIHSCPFPPYSIIPTAFLGTAVIFSCFSLSALFAKRRAYLYLGGKQQLQQQQPLSTTFEESGFIFVHRVSAFFFFSSGVLFSGLFLMLLFSLINIFLGSTWLFTVSGCCFQGPSAWKLIATQAPAANPPFWTQNWQAYWEQLFRCSQLPFKFIIRRARWVALESNRFEDVYRLRYFALHSLIMAADE